MGGAGRIEGNGCVMYIEFGQKNLKKRENLEEISIEGGILR
jgi:hypothetical protein